MPFKQSSKKQWHFGNTPQYFFLLELAIINFYTEMFPRFSIELETHIEFETFSSFCKNQNVLAKYHFNQQDNSYFFIVYKQNHKVAAVRNQDEFCDYYPGIPP